MIKEDIDKLAVAKTFRAEYMANHNLKRIESHNMVVTPLPGIINAVKRFMRRSWVKDGYLEDAQWIIDNGGARLHNYALENLNRNGWGQKPK